MTKSLRVSSAIFALIGFLTVGFGLFQIFFRSNFIFLPEDISFTGVNGGILLSSNPALFSWLTLVMRAWGVFILSTGLFIIFITLIPYRRGERWSWFAFLVSGASSLPIFLLGNFIIKSDFLFVLVSIAILYALALFVGARNFIGKNF